MPAIAHLGDALSHGGSVASASPDVYADGIQVARVTDRAFCAQHGVVVIVTGANTVLVNGLPAAHNGSLCSCGAVVISGGTVLVEGG